MCFSCLFLSLSKHPLLLWSIHLYKIWWLFTAAQQFVMMTKWYTEIFALWSFSTHTHTHTFEEMKKTTEKFAKRKNSFLLLSLRSWLYGLHSVLLEFFYWLRFIWLDTLLIKIAKLKTVRHTQRKRGTRTTTTSAFAMNKKDRVPAERSPRNVWIKKKCQRKTHFTVILTFFLSIFLSVSLLFCLICFDLSRCFSVFYHKNEQRK